MSVPEEIGLGGLAALGAVGSVCAVLLRSTHQNLKTLDSMRREASAASERLRLELNDHDNTIFKLQGMCADYRFAIAKLEAERDLLKRKLIQMQRRSGGSAIKNQKNQTNKPEDVL